MGRYYSGDINGKFWFGLQASNAASRFGGQEIEPQYIEYYFCEDDLEGVEEEIKRIEDRLGDKVKVIDDFFEKNTGYNDEMLQEVGISKDDLTEYADLKLGIQIRDCIKENDICSFNAEL